MRVLFFAIVPGTLDRTVAAVFFLIVDSAVQIHAQSYGDVVRNRAKR